MRKYFFQAVTAEGKQISGYVSAESIDQARDKLSNGGLSILTLEEPTEGSDTMEQGMRVYQFEAENKQKKKVQGTIEAIELYEAFKKLRLEYKLQVNYLVDSASAPSLKEKIKKEGLPPELEERLQVEIKIEKKKEKKKQKGVNANEVQDAVDANEEERMFIVEKIDAVLNEVVPLLEENAEFIDGHKKREIEERISLLMRLKHSNSVSHLRSLTQRLLEQISSDEIFLKDANIPSELLEEMDRRRSQFQAIGTTFDKAISKGLIDIQIKFSRLDGGALKASMRELKPFEKAANVFYLVFCLLGALCTVFLVFIFALNYFEIQPAQTLFFLQSPLIWYVWGLGVLMMISFYFLRFYPKQEWFENIVVIGCTVIGFIVYTVQFPIVFYWT
jgi:hypothetical protein